MDFLQGKQKNSNREHLMTFVNNELAAVRWRHYLKIVADYQRSLKKYPNPAGVLLTEPGT